MLSANWSGSWPDADNIDLKEYYSDLKTLNVKSNVWDIVPVQYYLSNIYTIIYLHS